VGGDEVYSAVLDIVLDVLESKHGIFGYIDAGGNFVAPSMTADVFAECAMRDKRAVFPPASWGNSIWGRAILQKRVLLSNEPLKVPPGHIPMLREISSPIVYQDRVIGLINVANKPCDYDDADVELLGTICAHVAPVLHARLQRDRHEEQRRQAEEALRQAHHELEARVVRADGRAGHREPAAADGDRRAGAGGSGAARNQRPAGARLRDHADVAGLPGSET